MLYELRQYDINPDNWDEFREWSLSRAFPVLFERFNLPLVAFFETVPAEDIEGETVNRTVGVTPRHDMLDTCLQSAAAM